MDKVPQDPPDDCMDEFYETNEAGERGRYHWEGRNLVFVPAEQDSEVPISSAEEEVEINVPVLGGGVLERDMDTLDWEYWREIEKSGGAPLIPLKAAKAGVSRERSRSRNRTKKKKSSRKRIWRIKLYQKNGRLKKVKRKCNGQNSHGEWLFMCRHFCPNQQPPENALARKRIL